MKWLTWYRASRRAHPLTWSAVDLVEGAAATAVLWLVVSEWVAIAFAGIWLVAMSLTALGQLRDRRPPG